MYLVLKALTSCALLYCIRGVCTFRAVLKMWAYPANKGDLIALHSRLRLNFLSGSPAMSFTNDDITQYGISKGSPEVLESITACFWMSVRPKTVSRRTYSTPLSYATKRARTGNGFTLMLMPDLVLLSNHHRIKYDAWLTCSLATVNLTQTKTLDLLQVDNFSDLFNLSTFHEVTTSLLKSGHCNL